MNLTLDERLKLAIPLADDSSYSQCSMYNPDWNKVGFYYISTNLGIKSVISIMIKKN